MITIDDDIFSDDYEINFLYDYFRYAGSWQFDPLPSSFVWSGKQSNATIEGKISLIIRKIAKAYPGFEGKEYEVWVNTLDRHIDHLNLHVDCDEYAEGIEPAKMTAVIFLGRDTTLEGGELVVDTEGYQEGYNFIDNIFTLTEKSKSPGWITIPFKDYRTILFTSNLPHGVLPIKNMANGEARISLMISAWDKKIKVKR